MEVLNQQNVLSSLQPSASVCPLTVNPGTKRFDFVGFF